MIGKFIYLTVTKPKIFFVAGLLGQFIYKLREVHYSEDSYIQQEFTKKEFIQAWPYSHHCRF